MQSARRLVAILSLAGLSALGSQATRGQEGGGFQVPLNSDPIIPIPTGQAGQPGYYTGPDFLLSSGSGYATRLHIVACVAKALAVIFRSDSEVSRPQVTDLPRKPKLGEYLIAEKLPPRLPTPAELQAPHGTQTLKVPDVPPVPVPLPPLPPRSAEPLNPRPVPLLPSWGKYGSSRGLPSAPTTAPDCTSVYFTGPTGMKVTWQQPDGGFKGEKDAPTTRQEYNFARGQVYRLRITNVLKDKPGRVFYPTFEVPASTAKTATFLKHSSVPVVFTADDFAQASAGTLVVKVIYLPDPDQQDFSTIASAEEVGSTRLELGVDPVAEAQRRGTILAIIRMGNIDLENRVSPAIGEGQFTPGTPPGSGAGRTRPRSDER